MSTRPPLGCSVPNMVQRYLGTEYDKVKSVADNIETVIEVTDNLDHIKVVENNLGIINTVATDIEEVVVVSSNIADVNSVVADMSYVKTVESSLENIVTVADNITDVVTVSDNIDYVKDVAEGIEGLPVVSYIGDTPPTQPLHGAKWYCTTDGRSYVWYKDVDSSQWVESSPQSTLETDAHKTRVAAMGGVINASIASVHAITDNVTISSISGGFDGQEITLVNVTGANVIVNQASNMRMIGGTFTMTPNDTLKFICAATTWFEVSRSSNN